MLAESVTAEEVLPSREASLPSLEYVPQDSSRENQQQESQELEDEQDDFLSEFFERNRLNNDAELDQSSVQQSPATVNISSSPRVNADAATIDISSSPILNAGSAFINISRSPGDVKVSADHD